MHKGRVFCVDWSPFEQVWFDDEDEAGNRNTARLPGAQDTEYGGLIASASGDRFVVVSTPNGDIVGKVRHPNTVFGCHWNKRRPGVLATACADGKVRLYHLKRKQGHSRRGSNSSAGGGGDSSMERLLGAKLTLVTCLTGHSKSIFRAIWSPHSPTLLASSSNDRTIRVWDTSNTGRASSRSRSSTNTSMAVLRGHRHHRAH